MEHFIWDFLEKSEEAFTRQPLKMFFKEKS